MCPEDLVHATLFIDHDDQLQLSSVKATKSTMQLSCTRMSYPCRPETGIGFTTDMVNKDIGFHCTCLERIYECAVFCICTVCVRVRNELLHKDRSQHYKYCKELNCNLSHGTHAFGRGRYNKL